jgi:hypothetical protein
MRVVELLAGENQQFDRHFGGAMCHASAIATGDTLINSGPGILYGYTIHVATATAATTIEDGLTAGGTVKLTIPSGKAVGEYALPVGILCATGIFLNFTGTGSVSVLYLPAA